MSMFTCMCIYDRYMVYEYMRVRMCTSSICGMYILCVDMRAFYVRDYIGVYVGVLCDMGKIGFYAIKSDSAHVERWYLGYPKRRTAVRGSVGNFFSKKVFVLGP